MTTDSKSGSWMDRTVEAIREKRAQDGVAVPAGSPSLLGIYTTAGRFLCAACTRPTDPAEVQVLVGDAQFHGADCGRCGAEVEPDDCGGAALALDPEERYRLVRLLLTCDGKGRLVKADALAVLLRAVVADPSLAEGVIDDAERAIP